MITYEEPKGNSTLNDKYQKDAHESQEGGEVLVNKEKKLRCIRLFFKKKKRQCVILDNMAT